MRGVTILNSHAEPYPHDYIIGRLFLWLFPGFVKPNHITIFRILATPLIFALMIAENWKIGLPAFILVAFTDALDGSMARIRKQITPWGTLFDPVADKFLVGGVLFILILKYVNIYIGAAIIVIELGIVIVGWLKMKEGVVISASRWGKTKMVLQVLGISLLLVSILFNMPIAALIGEWTLILSIGFALMNILHKGFSM